MSETAPATTPNPEAQSGGSVEMVLSQLRDTFPEIPTIETIELAQETLTLAPRDADGHIVDADGTLVDPELAEEIETLADTKTWRLSREGRKANKDVLRVATEDKLSEDRQKEFMFWQHSRDQAGEPSDLAAYKEYCQKWLGLDDELIRREQAERAKKAGENSRVLFTTGTNQENDAKASNNQAKHAATSPANSASTAGTTGTGSAATGPDTTTASAPKGKDTDNDTGKNNSRTRNGKDREPKIDAAKMQSIRDLRMQYAEVRSESRYPDKQALSKIGMQLNELYATLNPEEAEVFAEMKKEEDAAAKKQSQKELDDRLAKIRRDKVSVSQLAASDYKWKLPEAEIKEKERLAKEAQLKKMIGEVHPEGRTKRIAKASGKLAMRSMFATGRGVKKVTYTPAVSAKQAVAAKREESKEARFERDQDARERAYQREEMIWYAAAEKAKERRLAEARKRSRFVAGPDGLEYQPGEEEEPKA